jgi:hypothetical protein
VLSFTQLSNSCTITIAAPDNLCEEKGTKELCSGLGSSTRAAYAVSVIKADDGSSLGSIFCGWSVGLSANRLFAGFLNFVFCILHLVNTFNGRMLLVKSSSYISISPYPIFVLILILILHFVFVFALLIYFIRYAVYFLFSLWWFANMCSDSNVSFQPLYL